jgi:lauroyl/myristoyl acyltransferase
MTDVAGRAADLGYALGWRLVGALPAPVAAGGFRMGADLASRRSGPGVRQLRANLARVLACRGAESELGDESDLDAVVTEGVRSYARYWREAFRLPRMDALAVYDSVESVIQGTEHLDHALEAGRGVLIALTHSGNWDVAGLWLVEALRRRGRPPTFATVAERLRPASLYDRFVDYRRSLGFEVLPADAGARTVATLAARLRAGGVVCLVADRDLSGTGVEVDFFGARARMPGGPAQLARHTGAALLPVASWFTEDGWGLRLRPPPVAPSGAAAGTGVAVVTQMLADAFASGIAAHPADWHMLQPIWTADRVRSEVGT